MVSASFARNLCICCFLAGICLAGEDTVYNLAEYYFQQGNYPAAITEYKRFLFFHPSTPQKEYIFYQIGQAYKEYREYKNALIYIQFAANAAQDQKTVDEYNIESALILIKCNQYALAKLKLLKIIHFSHNEHLRLKANYFMGVCSALEHNWSSSRQYLQDYFIQTNPSLTASLDSLYRLHDRYRYKSPKLAKWLSTFLPGSGQIYARDYRQGLNALGVNIVFGYLLYYGLSERQIFDVLIVYFTLFHRYYSGNRYHAERIAREYNHSLDAKFRQQVTDFLYQHAE
jgi:tetratricopeptide (TPR) repeat protein